MALHLPSHKGPSCSGAKSPFQSYPPLSIHSSTEQNVSIPTVCQILLSAGIRGNKMCYFHLLKIHNYRVWRPSTGCLIVISKLHVQNSFDLPSQICFPHSLLHFSKCQWSFFHFFRSEALTPSLTSLSFSHNPYQQI